MDRLVRNPTGIRALHSMACDYSGNSTSRRFQAAIN